jgi:hypothetical protein
VRQESQQLDSSDKRGEDTLSKSQRKQWRKKEREREKRKREHEKEQESGHTSNRFNQEENTIIGLDSAEWVNKRRKKKKKKRRSHQMVFELTLYTDLVYNV